jgi:hypothetical protein
MGGTYNDHFQRVKSQHLIYVVLLFLNIRQVCIAPHGAYIYIYNEFYNQQLLFPYTGFAFDLAMDKQRSSMK